MKFKNLFISLGLALAVGAGVGVGLASGQHAQEAKADGTNTTVYCAIDVADVCADLEISESNFSLKCNVNRQGDADNFQLYDMADSAKDLGGYDLYSATFTDLYGGLGAIEFFVYDGATKKAQDTVFGPRSWKSASVYNYKVHIYGTTVGSDNSDWFYYGYSLVGDFPGHTWDNDLDLEMDLENHKATVSDVSMKKGNSFKVRVNNSWTHSYNWDAANGHITVTDPLEREEEACFGDAGPNDHNIAVFHNGTYNFSFDYVANTLTITGTRAASDSPVAFEMYIAPNPESLVYEKTELALKQDSETEFMIQRDFTAGEKFYCKFGSSYYHYSHIKDDCTLKGTQFVANGQDVEVLYSATYTFYFETSNAESNFGGWLQYDSTSAAQARANVISYAEYFNDTVGGACDDQGGDGSEAYLNGVRDAWQSVATRFNNAPADDTNDIKAAIKAATDSDENEDVVEFVEKYARVYYLRGSLFGDKGGNFLQKLITPKAITNIGGAVETNAGSVNYVAIIAIASVVSLVAVGAFFFVKKRKED